ncbi:ThuA domain-containing protein [Streptomyces sp. TRM 70361]|uniref:ThuA domain-containing protein n=1 Tax=Streptomyces sp. TRM 70361 TaxID=3116553 RepID=UPI002E7AE2A1|nr:ThuA domain-containing protein [Streptomyces sp. TRM 70361]MEE1940729.1 ThuA domain-containing protein [Streptomyces sp. TRM 70361]
MTYTGILVFTRTADYRHDSIPDGVDAFRSLGDEHGFAVTATEEPGEFAAALADGCRAVVFLSTSGEVLTPGSRAALRTYVEGGGAFVGVHAAATTEYDWPWYGELVGARFERHPDLQPGSAVVEDHDHPATAHLDAVWPFTDEWYDFRTSPRGRVRVLLSADETTYEGGGMGEDHPLAWCHENTGGRSFYTALGHTRESYSDPAFRRHLLGGLAWAARLPVRLPARP